MKTFLQILLFLVICTTGAMSQPELYSYAENDSPQAIFMPRYLNDKLIVESKGFEFCETCTIHVYSSFGKNMYAHKLSSYSSNQFILRTETLRKGVYVYYIVVDNQPIVRGQFTKS